MVKFVKLVSGEEIIVDIMEDPSNESGWILKKPHLIQLVPHNNQMAYTLLPLVLILDKEQFKISKNHVMLIEDAPSEINEEYCKKTGNIIVPSSLNA